MANTALQQVASLNALKEAWSDISRRKLGKPGASRAGPDGESLASFAIRVDAQSKVLSNEILSKKFRFSKLDPHFIPKPDGKYRVICVPSVADRVVQRAILRAIGKKQAWMQNAVSYGFVADGGVERAASKAVQYRKTKPWVFKTDITKFFDHVGRDLLKEKVVRQVKQKTLHPMLFDAINCEIEPRTKQHAIRIKALGIIEGRGVRQGMPLSPFFANLFLADFDRTCINAGHSVLRYADDLIFFASSESEAIALQSFCADELKKVELQIPEIAAGAKSQIYAPDQAAEFLGVELVKVGTSGYQICLGKKQFDNIKENIYSLQSLAELRRRGLEITRFGNSLAARVAAYSATYEFCSNADQLEICLGDWAKATRRKVALALGIDLSALSDDGHWFLGLNG